MKGNIAKLTLIACWIIVVSFTFINPKISTKEKYMVGGLTAPVPLQLTPIENLNQGGAAINSHSGLSSRSSLMMNFRSYVEISGETNVSAPVYPRVRKMANGNYIMFYQNNQIGADTYYVTSTDLKTWTGGGTKLFARHAIVDQNGANNERRFSTANALVLANGDIIAVASYRANTNYLSLPLNNGIIMRKSADNGLTWSTPVEIYQGTNWEPHLMQLPSGEIHCYFTDSRVHIGADNTGTALIVSNNNGQTWTPSFGNAPRRVIRKKFKEENGVSLYTDQMPGVIKLNNSNELAAVTEARNPASSVYNISLAYSGSSGQWTNLTLNQEGPADRQNYVFPGAGPSMGQFRSGETVMSYNTSGLYHMRLGDATARTFSEPYTPFTKTGFWGTLEVIDSHQVIGAMHTAGSIMLSRFSLNHAIRTTHRAVNVNGNNSEWENTDAALFVGQKSQAQATLRSSADANNIYFLVEVLDNNISTGDYVDIYLTPSGGNGQLNADSRRIRVSANGLVRTDKYTGSWSTVSMGVSATSAYDGTISNNSNTDNGYLVEIAIPKSQLDMTSGQLLANLSLYDAEAATTDAIASISSTSTDNWIPVFFSLITSQAQAVITGVMADPRWIDSKTAPSSGEGVVSQSVRHYGGFEYVQLRATEDIDFSITPFSVVIARNDATNRVTNKGWAEGGNVTFKFNLTSGTVSKGDYFYVGGLEKRIGGYKNGTKSTDISETAPITSNRAKWIRAKNVSLGGDDGLGLKPRDTIGLMDPENPYAIAVFSTTYVISATKPIDALFFIPNSTSIAYVQYSASGNKGYRVPTNDLYDSAEATYFYQNGKNTSYLEPEQVSVPKHTVSKAQLHNQTTWNVTNDANYSWFGKLGGVYSSVSKTWTTPRSAIYDRLMLVGSTENTHQDLTLSRIESDATVINTLSNSGFNKTNNDVFKTATFPLKLNSLTAQGSNYSILLKWSNLTETDNSRYDILRSFDKNREFEVIASVKGKGVVSKENSYNFRDQAPYNGINYYQLKLIDKTGEITHSNVVQASTAIDRAKLKIVNAKDAIEFSIYSLHGGKFEITLLNINGNILKKENVYLSKGFNNISWINSFPIGVYVVKAASPTELMNEKFVIK